MYMYIYIHLYMYIYVDIDMYTHTYMYIYVCIYIQAMYYEHFKFWSLIDVMHSIFDLWLRRNPLKSEGQAKLKTHLPEDSNELLQCVAVRCSALCCSTLQWVAGRRCSAVQCSVLQRAAVCCSMLLPGSGVSSGCSALQRVVLQCVAGRRCSVLLPGSGVSSCCVASRSGGGAAAVSTKRCISCWSLSCCVLCVVCVVCVCVRACGGGGSGGAAVSTKRYVTCWSLS